MRTCWTLLTWITLSSLASSGADEILPIFPAQKSVHVLAASADSPVRPYLAFPAVLDLGAEVLVSFKEGSRHYGDPGAVLGMVRVEKASGEVNSPETLAEKDGEIMQMGEWVRFPNGDVANYIDSQGERDAPLRAGLCVVRSTDGGRTFGPTQRLGVVDGVEYGYAFDSITRGDSTWMLVMTFANLTGGELVHETGSQPGSVDVIRSEDNGRTWRFVRSLTEELGGIPINESSFVAHGDGFLVAARGYGSGQWLLRTDADFRLLSKTDFAAANEFIGSPFGRPRLFHRDGSYYLLGRNWVKKGLMQLALFRFDPENLAIDRHVVLDNAEKEPVQDGYYAQPYWRENQGRTLFEVVTYKRSQEKGPDIIRIELDWEEVR